MVIQLRYRDLGWRQIGKDYNINQTGYSNDLCAEVVAIVSLSFALFDLEEFQSPS